MNTACKKGAIETIQFIGQHHRKLTKIMDLVNCCCSYKVCLLLEFLTNSQNLTIECMNSFLYSFLYSFAHVLQIMVMTLLIFADFVLSFYCVLQYISQQSYVVSLLEWVVAQFQIVYDLVLMLIMLFKANRMFNEVSESFEYFIWHSMNSIDTIEQLFDFSCRESEQLILRMIKSIVASIRKYRFR